MTETAEAKNESNVAKAGNGILKVGDKVYREFTHELYDDFLEEDVSFSIHFRKITSPEANRCQSKMGKKSAQAYHNLCLGAVHPDDKQQMLADFKEYPGLATTFGNKLLDIAGFGELGN